MYFIGLDEAGRGAWAGPLFASLVVVNKKNVHLLEGIGVKDSKKLSQKRRMILCENIASIVDFYTVEKIEVNVIDEVGIHNANKIIFQNLINKVPYKFLTSGVIYIDGSFSNLELFLYENNVKKTLKHNSVIDGDALIPVVSAASIIAKVHRDNFMINLSSKYSNYAFQLHKGYGTKLHRQLIQKFGICDQHRKSFKPIREHISLV